MISNPPNTKAKVITGDIIDNKTTNLKSLNVLENNLIRFKKEFSDTGEYVFFIVCELKDTNGLILLSDSITKKLRVKL
jgi:hypothetical protein